MKKLLLLIALAMFLASPSIAAFNPQSIGWLGNADRTFRNGEITCYLGALAPGMPTYFCGWNTPEGFAMDHSWLAKESAEMNKYYTGSPTFTYSGR